jgi:hypothetical protein
LDEEDIRDISHAIRKVATHYLKAK